MTKRSTARTKARPVGTREAILTLLKQRGPSDSEALAAELDISAMAVRQHLYALRQQKLISHREEPRSVGRPAKLWFPTSAANRFFPDAHASLTVSLLNAMSETFGEEGVQRLVTRCAKRQISDYRSRIPVHAPLQARLEALISIRNEEGFMAEVQSQRDGSFLLIENHCPISAAANVCPKLCNMEMKVFRAILGEGVAIEREEHMVAGARRCVYRIRTGES